MVAVVYATGASTFFGRTAKLVQAAGAVSHFQRAVMHIGNILIISAASLSILLIVVELYRGLPLLTLLSFVLIVVVASIPVALPAVLSVTMALGALALSRMKAIVSRLKSIEEMAEVTVLCSDKTGTLTQNRLTLGDPVPIGAANPHDVVLAGALACKKEDHDAIDTAVLAELTDKSELSLYRQLAFVPFDPVHQRTEATVERDGRQSRVTKGAPQVVMQLSKLEAADRARADEAVNAAAAKGFGTLGVARSDDGATWRFLRYPAALRSAPRGFPRDDRRCAGSWNRRQDGDRRQRCDRPRDRGAVGSRHEYRSRRKAHGGRRGRSCGRQSETRSGGRGDRWVRRGFS